MLGILLAALQIAWSGVGYVKMPQTVPVIVANPPAARVPLPGLTLLALQDGRYVDADWSTTPEGAIDLDAAWPKAQSYRGPVTIHARYGSSSASTPGFVYGSASVGCYIGSVNGLRFDDSGVAHSTGTPRESDIYAEGPANAPPMDIFSGCIGPFVSSSALQLHAPFGASVISHSSRQYFGYVRPSEFHGEYTRLPALQTGDIVLFRTRDGRLVKMLDYEPAPGVLGGAYLVAQPRADFSDYAFYARHKYAPRALFGPHHD
jgi:hypothetical protein